MNDESLSALADGELDADTTRFVLRRCERDRDARVRWTRWHLVRASLRGEPVLVMDAGFADRVMAALEPAPATRRWLRPVAGGAIAAAVAVFALSTVRQVPDVAPGAAPSPSLATTAPIRTGDLAPILVAQPASSQAGAQRPSVPWQFDPFAAPAAPREMGQVPVLLLVPVERTSPAPVEPSPRPVAPH